MTLSASDLRVFFPLPLIEVRKYSTYIFASNLHRRSIVLDRQHGMNV
jgi:hypothetical protein